MFTGYTLFAQETIFKNTLVYSENEGLSSSNIHKIIQDDYGFIWVASQDGLNRFDGKTFVLYNKNESIRHRLFSADVREIINDTVHKMIWAVCNNGGINGIDIATGCVQYSIPYGNKLMSTDWRICATLMNGMIYIGTSGGLEVFDIGNTKFVQPLSGPGGTNLFEHKSIWTITSDNKNFLWLGIKDEGIVIYNPAKKEILFRVTPHVFANITGAEASFWPLSSTFSNDSICWVGTKNGMICLVSNPSHAAARIAADDDLSFAELQHQQVNAVVYKTGEQLLIAATQLYQYDIAEKKLIKLASSNSAGEEILTNTTSCFEDREHNFWVGCKQGLITVKQKAPLFTPVINGKKFDGKLSHVFSLQPVEDNKILVGTQEGLFQLQNDRLTALYTKGRVQNLFRLTIDDILVSGNEGIQLFHSNQLIPVNKRFPEFKQYENRQFNSCIALSDSIVLIGTESNDGILIWNKQKHTVENIKVQQGVQKGIASDIVNSVFLTSDGKAVILSDYVISIYDRRTKQFENIILKGADTANPSGIFMEMNETANNYWINAYGEGLLKLDKHFNLIKRYGSATGLGNEGLYKIFNKADSLLYLTSNNGIAVFNIREEKFSHYNKEDGLHGNEFEEACGVAWSSYFYAGGTNGFVKINPDVMQVTNTTPTVYFSRLLTQWANGKSYDTTNLDALHFTIAADIVQTTLFFSGINYENPGRVNYRYQIIENSSEWINQGTTNFISFIVPTPGDYHIKVSAKNESGIWSTPRELVITFLPKWYQTVWFKIFLALVLSGMIYALYRYRIAQIKKQHEIRRSIANDLHDDLGSTLNSVKVFTNLAISGVNQNESLLQIKDNLNEATAGLRDMIWVLDDSMDTVDELINRLKQFALPVTALSGIAFEIKAEADAADRKLSKEEKRNLYLVCKEAINNSIKYATPQKIAVVIIPFGKKISISVSDDGKGFDTAASKKGYGLKNMQYRMKQIRFTCTINSSAGTGTVTVFQPD